MLSRNLLLAVSSMFALEASAFWRLPCQDRLVLERIDPIESPGKFASHVHTVHGAQNFRMSSTDQDLRSSECTSCAVKQDLSAYWTPNLYWQEDNGEFTALNQTGGMLVYYLQRSHETDIPTPEGDKLHIFPPDFRVIAGDARQRNFTWREEMGQLDDGTNIFDLKSLWSAADRQNEAMKRQDAVGFNCLNYAAPAEGALMRKGLPKDMHCPDGLRAEIFFPSCWNGKDSDSPNHKDHMRYPSLVQDGECPEGFKYRLPSLFFETIWDIDYAQGRSGRLVLSDGDPTGYGYHGDFMNGWDQDVLRRAVNECTDPSGVVDKCTIFDLQSLEDQKACKKTDLDVEEEVWGPLTQLPGCNVITEEPHYAPKSKGCDSDAGHVAEITGEAPEEEEEEEEEEQEEEVQEEQSEEETVQNAEADVGAPAPGMALPGAPAPAMELPAGIPPVDEFNVHVTVTEYHHEAAVTQVVQGADVTEVVTAEAVVETVYAKRDLHRRAHGHGHKH